MGNGGGLVITRHKSYNVYGREQRLKVARDEKAAAAAAAIVDKRHALAESEFVRQGLLERARSKTDKEPESESVEQLPPPPPPFSVHTIAPTDLVPTLPRCQHINFWEVEERNAAPAKHPEVEAERREAKRRRGEEKTQTSDARFDEGFQFAHRMADKTPWYAKPVKPEGKDAPLRAEDLWGMPANRQPDDQPGGAPGDGSDRPPSSETPCARPAGASGDDAAGARGGPAAVDTERTVIGHTVVKRTSAEGRESSKRRHSKTHRHKTRRSHSVKDRRRTTQALPSGKALRSVAQMREERLQRESVEHSRAAHVMKHGGLVASSFVFTV